MERHPESLCTGIFNDSFPPIMDGVTLTVDNYARGLLRMGLNPCVVTPWNPCRVEVPYQVVKYFSLPIHNRHPYRYGYPKLDPFIWRRLRRMPFSIVHAHSPFSAGRLGVYVKKKQGVPLIGTFHSKYRDDLRHSFTGPMSWMVDVIMKRILDFFNACDEVWIPQAKVADTVREYGFKGELTVVDNGNDYAGMGDAELELYRHESRMKLGMTSGGMNLLFVGQHIFEKGTDVIIRSLGLLRDRTDLRMDFIGTGYAAEELKHLSQREGVADRVLFHGVIHDRETLRRHYAAADLFLFPSMYDNAPIVVREAAAMGTPSVLPFGCTASEVIEDGVNGFLTQRSPEAYARIISRLSSDPRAVRVAAAGARTSLARSWDDVVEEVADRYQHLIRRNG
ncbi:MAG: glycosyltransferase [Muribaculaceae bacterium]|nr:glycosyltransferase [Muribaculaceae bacterium]